jgi:hypothetical protein
MLVKTECTGMKSAEMNAGTSAETKVAATNAEMSAAGMSMEGAVAGMMNDAESGATELWSKIAAPVRANICEYSKTDNVFILRPQGRFF